MLYIVSTPIGNPDDLSVRALRVLREANAIICEEPREGSRLLHYYKIEKQVIALNEHTERERVPELIERLMQGETLALISDHGTPLLADPGARLVEQAIEKNILVSPVPGASSLLAGLVVSGLPMQRFRFVGMLPVKREERQQALRRLKEERDTWILMDAPYRLQALLADITHTLGPQRSIVAACNLTLPDEKIIRGTAGQVTAYFRQNPFKGEYVIVVAGRE